MLVLAIETSCDETSAAVVKDGTEVLSNVISSQVDFHRKYGGIVPEIAARKHIEVINPIIKEALEKSQVDLKDLDAVAVTYGPGLIGSLLVGLCAAKAIAYAKNIPLIGVNHLAGHIYANFINPLFNLPLSKGEMSEQSEDRGGQGVSFPFICLLVSGGHTMLIFVKGHGEYKTLGRTRDDAAGEAFDKIARFLNLGYPGGPIIDKLAKEGNPAAISFKRPMIEESFGYDFSFSGLKTAVVNYVTRYPLPVTRYPDLVASFQQAIIDVLVEKALRAAKEYGCQTIALAGGVSANSQLRKQLLNRCQTEGLTAQIPLLEYCTDNAAMVGCAGYYQMRYSPPIVPQLDLSPVASLKL